MMSKIVIPSDDNITIARHFGKAKGFVIANVEQGKVVNKEYVENTFTHHAHESHQSSSVDINSEKLHLHHEHQHTHSHDRIFQTIGNCDIVIAGGMGKRLYQDFLDRDTRVFVCKENDIDKALQMCIGNTLDSNIDLCCEH